MVRFSVCRVLLLVGMTLTVCSTPSAQSADDDYRKAIVEAIRNDVVGRSFTTPQPLVEEYKDKGFRVESWREVSFSNLLEAKNGFQFDMTVTAYAQRVTLDGDKRDPVRVKTTSTSRYECRSLDATRSYVGIQRTIVTTSGQVLGDADSVEIKLIDGKVAILQKDIHPRVDSNDQKLFTSQTSAYIHLKREQAMTVKYVEYAVDEKTLAPGKKRTDAELSYKETREGNSK